MTNISIEISLRQSKIENPKSKWWGFALVLTSRLLGCGDGAAAEESPADRVSIGARPALSPPVPRQFGWLCASLATSKDRTSPSSTDMRRGSSIGFLILRPSWCVSRLISSW